MSVVARPFCKWVGGKTALLPEILSRLPKNIGTYYEPFVGGGAVYFALAAERRFKTATISDMNAELIGAYVNIATHTNSVIRRLEKYALERHALEMRSDSCEEHYYAVRALDPWKLDPPERAARFIFLNKTGFNGLYRVNRKGGFNVPFGRYTNPTICDESNLRAVAEVLGETNTNTNVAVADFEEIVKGARRGDAVYFDPPYVPVSETANFTAYAAGGFGPEEQKRLRDVAARLVERGVHVLLSNSDTPLVRKLYGKEFKVERGKEFKIERVKAPRRVNSKGDKRGNVGELLISGKDA